MIPEISDRIVEIDRAMRWGYAHKLGPFELWDALGFVDVVTRLESEDRAIPENIEKMLSRAARFRSTARPGKRIRAPNISIFIRNAVSAPGAAPTASYRWPIASAPMAWSQKNAGASLVDLGDGVLCVEFHSKMNALGEDNIGMLYAGLEETNKNFDAMVIANQGENFSVGANLMMVLLAAQEGEWDELDAPSIASSRSTWR